MIDERRDRRHAHAGKSKSLRKEGEEEDERRRRTMKQQEETRGKELAHPPCPWPAIIRHWCVREGGARMKWVRSTDFFGPRASMAPATTRTSQPIHYRPVRQQPAAGRASTRTTRENKCAPGEGRFLFAPLQLCAAVYVQKQESSGGLGGVASF